MELPFQTTFINDFEFMLNIAQLYIQFSYVRKNVFLITN